MKILIINSVCGIGSTGRISTDLAEILEKEGHECKVAYGRGVVPENCKKYAVRIGNDRNIKIDGLKTRLLDNAGFNSKAVTKKFLKWVKEYNPDLIHLHNVHGYYINIELLFNFLKDFGKPVVWTLHDCWAFTGHCSHYTEAGCYKWQTECKGKCIRKKAYPKSMFISRAKRNFTKKKKLFTSLDKLSFITPSEWLANEARQSFLGKYEVKAIPNGVDLDVFKPTKSNFREKYGLEGKKIILGVATAWGVKKGTTLFAKLSQTLTDDYKVVLVGMTKEQAEKMPKEVLVIPRTNSVEELAEIYTAADVFLNLGKEETMGLTTVEAFACGTPAVTSNRTAVPEVVDENSGIVLENLEIDTIIDGITKVLAKEYPNTRSRAEIYEKSAQYNKYLANYKKFFK